MQPLLLMGRMIFFQLFRGCLSMQPYSRGGCLGMQPHSRGGCIQNLLLNSFPQKIYLNPPSDGKNDIPNLINYNLPHFQKIMVCN